VVLKGGSLASINAIAKQRSTDGAPAWTLVFTYDERESVQIFMLNYINNITAERYY